MMRSTSSSLREEFLNRARALSVTLIGLPLVMAAVGRAQSLRVVAYDNEPAPGSPGQVLKLAPAGFFNDLYRGACFDAAGEVVFWSGGSDTANGLWKWNNGSASPIVRAGDVIGDMSVANVGTAVVANSAGQLAVKLNGGLYRATPSGPTAGYSYEPFVVPGQIMPHFEHPTSVVYDDFTLGPNGHMSVTAEEANTNSRRGWFAGVPGSVQLLARENEPNPLGYTPAFIEVGSADAAGRFSYFVYNASGTSGPTYRVDLHGAALQIAAPGTPAPGTSLNFGTWGSPAISSNTSGTVAFSASLQTSGHLTFGVWTGDPQQSQLLALGGTRAPGTPKNFNNFYGQTISENGNTAFYSGLDDNQTNGIWAGAPGSIAKVAVTGELLPGSSLALTGIDMWPLVNDLGQVAFLGVRDGTSNLRDGGDGLWAGEPSNLRLIAQRGDVFDLGGQARVVDRLFMILDSDMAGLGQYSSGKARGLDDQGDLLFFARFTDGSMALMMANVPEPAAGALACAGVLYWVGAARCRRRSSVDRESAKGQGAAGGASASRKLISFSVRNTSAVGAPLVLFNGGDAVVKSRLITNRAM